MIEHIWLTPTIAGLGTIVLFATVYFVIKYCLTKLFMKKEQK